MIQRWRFSNKQIPACKENDPILLISSIRTHKRPSPLLYISLPLRRPAFGGFWMHNWQIFGHDGIKSVAAPMTPTTRDQRFSLWCVDFARDAKIRLEIKASVTLCSVLKALLYKSDSSVAILSRIQPDPYAGAPQGAVLNALHSGFKLPFCTFPYRALLKMIWYDFNSPLRAGSPRGLWMRVSISHVCSVGSCEAFMRRLISVCLAWGLIFSALAKKKWWKNESMWYTHICFGAATGNDYYIDIFPPTHPIFSQCHFLQR